MTAEPFGRYVKGSRLNTLYDDDGYLDWFDANYYLKWSASDTSGICAQTLTMRNYDTQGGPDDPILGSETRTVDLAPDVRTYTYQTNLVDASRLRPRFVLRVTDCFGNTTASPIIDTQFGLREDSSSSVAYDGQWRVAKFNGFSGGTTHYSTRAGDTVQLTGLTAGPLALVLEAKADRGAFDVFVDGSFRATVDTKALGKQHRTVAWQIILTSGRTHTLKVVNRGTAGRPRIDLDAVLTGTII